MDVPKTFKLSELAEAAGVSSRTVRYYVQRGLLPAPEFRGPDTAYDQNHLLRLKAIRVLQDRFLPLESIAVELRRADRATLEELASGAGKLSAQVPVVPPVQAHEPQSDAAAISLSGTRWTRHHILPGLELQVSQDASPEAQALATRLLALARELEDGGSNPQGA